MKKPLLSNPGILSAAADVFITSTRSEAFFNPFQAKLLFLYLHLSLFDSLSQNRSSIFSDLLQHLRG